MASAYVRKWCATFPGSAPRAVPFDGTDSFLQLYFRRAARNAVLGLIAASSTACGEEPPGAATLPPDTAEADAAVASEADAHEAEASGPPPLAQLPSVPFPTGPAQCPAPTIPTYEPFGCDAASLVELKLDLTSLVQPADYLGLRDLRLMGSAWSSAQVGEACATATDKAVCRATLAALCTAQSCIVTTRGDAVEAWRTADELQRLFGSITSASEALALLLRAQDLPPRCTTPDAFGYRELRDGYEILTHSLPAEPGYEFMRYLVTRDGSTSRIGPGLYTPFQCPGGRRPPGLLSREHAEPHGSALARYLAALAHLEAASVPAFQAIERELQALAAPEAILAKVRQAILDERDHAARIGALAERFGMSPEAPRLRSRAVRGAAELALDNVVEGCVRESFGALIATFQASHADDPELRATFACIARDETRHAALAFQIQAWLGPRLSERVRARLDGARRAAIADLRRDIEQPFEPELIAWAGLPTVPEARVLLDHVQALWVDAVA